MSNGMTPCFIPNLPVMVLLAIVYLIAGKLGLLLAFVNPSATAVWAPTDIFKFALLAGILSTMVAATVGVTRLALAGFANWTDYGSIGFTWCLGDAMGAFMVAPLLVLWFRNPRIQWQRSRALEVGLLL